MKKKLLIQDLKADHVDQNCQEQGHPTPEAKTIGASTEQGPV
jgi:hypothetical protein